MRSQARFDDVLPVSGSGSRLKCDNRWTLLKRRAREIMPALSPSGGTFRPRLGADRRRPQQRLGVTGAPARLIGACSNFGSQVEEETPSRMYSSRVR